MIDAFCKKVVDFKLVQICSLIFLVLLFKCERGPYMDESSVIHNKKLKGTKKVITYLWGRCGWQPKSQC